MSGELHAEDEQFARLAFRHLEGLATSAEQVELAALMKREPTRLAQFAGIARQHGLLGELLAVPGASPAIATPTVAEPPIGGATQVLRRSSRRIRLFRRRRPSAPVGWRAAAAGVLVLVLGGVLVSHRGDEVIARLERDDGVRIERGGHAVRGLALHVGDHLTMERETVIVLRDGSRIIGAGGSRVTLTSGDRLDLAVGRVQVQAVKRHAGTLVIASSLADARVVGTTFTVAVESGRTRLDVAEGLVRFVRSTDNAALDVPASSWAEVATGVPFVVHQRVSPAPAVSERFVLGVNLNGGPVTIDGNRWWSQSEAVTHGLVLPGNLQVTATAVTPIPAVERAVADMLNTAIYLDTAIPLSLPLADGMYDVELWLMENYEPAYRSLTITIEGEVVADRVQDGDPKGAWHRLTYPVTISDGRLDLVIGAPGQDAHLMGFSVKRR